MKTSARGVAFIKAWEGFVPHTYSDAVSVTTVGYGHKVLPGERFVAPLTEAQATDLMLRDLAPVEAALTSTGWALTQPQFDALASWLFNCGVGALRGSTVERCVREGRLDDVPAALELWCRGRVDHRLVTLPGLLARRRAEGALWREAPAAAPPEGLTDADRAAVEALVARTIYDAQHAGELDAERAPDTERAT